MNVNPPRAAIAAALILLLSQSALAFPGQNCQDSPGLFWIESPREVAGLQDAGMEVWQTFWMDGSLIVVGSVPLQLQARLGDWGRRSGRIEPPGPGEGIFVVTAPRGIDPVLLAERGQVLLSGERVALIRAFRSSAEALTTAGCEIEAVMPALRRPVSPVDESGLQIARAFALQDGIQELIDMVNQADLGDLLGNLSGENSVTITGSPYVIQTRHSYHAEPISQATRYCYDLLQEYGLGVSFHDYTYNGHQLRNVVGEQTGSIYPNNIYIICGHLDDVPDATVAPGADDNASGSVAVLTAARILSGHAFENSIRYVLFTGEEQGMIGSYYYVQELIGEGKNILGALNFDQIAYDGNADGVVEIHCGDWPGSWFLGDLFIDTIVRYSIPLIPEKVTVGSETRSDHVRFWEVGYLAILGIQDLNDFNPDYHTADDTRDTCSLDLMTAYVKGAVGTIARLGLLMPSPAPSPEPTPLLTPSPHAPTPTTTPPQPSPTPSGGPSVAPAGIDSGDYNGDGTSDIAIFRGSSGGAWSVQNLTRIYFGGPTDYLAPADYNGDGTTDVAIFRPNSGMWSVRNLSRFYLGTAGDVPVPGDYFGNGTAAAGLFRGAGGLWAIRNLTRAYFGSPGDLVIPGHYDSDGAKDIAVFRPNSGMWSVRGLTRFYFGSATDDLVPGDYTGEGRWEGAIFRPSSGMWSIRKVTRFYLGISADSPVPADYNGNGVDDAGIFRDFAGLWSIRDLSRVYFGSTSDIPVTR